MPERQRTRIAEASQQRALVRVGKLLLALGLLLTIGTLGFMTIEGMPMLDAVYMTVITVSTVGYGEVEPLEPAGRIFTIFLIAFGGGVAAYVLGVVAEFVLSGEFQERLEYRRRLRMRNNVHNHTIVCGFGRMGHHVVEELLRQNMPLVVIEPDETKIRELTLLRVPTVHGDAEHEHHLLAAGIERARALIVVANSDAVNVFIVLTARSLRSDLLIVARANEEESDAKLRRAGANRVITPYSLAGRRIVTLVERPAVSDFLDEVMHSGDIELLLEQITIETGSPLVGKTLGSAALRTHFGITVIACRHPDSTFTTNPSATTELRAGAQMIVLGTHFQLQQLRDLSATAPAPVQV